MKKIFLTLLCSFFCFASPVWATTVEDLAQALKAEKVFVVADQEPVDGGPIGHFFLEAQGAHLLDLRIDELKLEGWDVVIAPQDQWKGGEPRLEKAGNLALYVKVTAQDIDAYTDGARFYGGDVTDVTVELGDDELTLKGTFMTTLWGISMPVKLSLQTGFEPRAPGTLWLRRPQVRTFGLRLPGGMQQKLLSKIEPLVDLNRWGVSADIDQPTIDAEAFTAATRRRPRPFFGAYTLTIPTQENEHQ